jgi:hypothetical protein
MPRRALDALLVRVHPEAQDLRADEPDRQEPEEEAIGEPACEQAAAVVELALKGLEAGVDGGEALTGGRADLDRPLR